MHRWNLLHLHIILTHIHSCLLVLFPSRQRFHHLFRNKLGTRLLSKQSLQIRKFVWPIMSSWKIYKTLSLVHVHHDHVGHAFLIGNRVAKTHEATNSQFTTYHVYSLIISQFQSVLHQALFHGLFFGQMQVHHWHVVSSVFFPFSLKSFLALIRGSTTLTGRWSWKFLVISWHKMQRFTCDETGLETHAPLESSAPPYNSNSYSLLPSCAVSVAPAFFTTCSGTNLEHDCYPSNPCRFADSSGQSCPHERSTKHSALSTSITTMSAMLS